MKSEPQREISIFRVLPDRQRTVGGCATLRVECQNWPSVPWGGKNPKHPSLPVGPPRPAGGSDWLDAHGGDRETGIWKGCFRHLRKEGKEGAGAAASLEAPGGGAGAACGVPATGAAPEGAPQPPLDKVSIMHSPWARNAGQCHRQNIPQ